MGKLTHGGLGSNSSNWWNDFWKGIGNWFQGINKGSAKVWNDVNGTTAIDTQYGYQSQLQEDQQAFNSAEAEKDRQWQEQMANTQYQRTAADLRAAGLNPWLAVNGLTASTPGGASASSSAGSVSQPPSGAQTVASLATTAMSAAVIVQIIKKLLK